MNKLHIVLTVCGAGFAAVNYTVYLLVSKRASLPIAPIVLLCIFVPLTVLLLFGKKLDRAAPVLMSALKWIYISTGLLYTVSFTVFSLLVMNVKGATDTADVFIVFGCKTNGFTPSKLLSLRLEKAYELLEANPGAYAVLSGGQGEDESVSEAESMRAYLCAKGISEDRLILEDRSTSTEENIRYSMQLIKDGGLKADTVAAVSSDYHENRILYQAKKLGYDVRPAPAKTPFTGYFYANLVREYMVWIRMLISS